MENLQITQVAFFGACALSAIFTLILTLKITSLRIHWSMIFAGVFNTAWLFSVAYYYPLFDFVFSEDPHQLTASANSDSLAGLYFFEVGRISLWTFALVATGRSYCPKCLPRFLFLCIKTFCIFSLLFAALNLQLQIIGVNSILPTFWVALPFCIGSLVIIEQLYRNQTEDRLLRLLCVCLALSLIFDAYHFSQSLAFSEVNEDHWQIRASIAMISSILMSIGVLTLPTKSLETAKISISRPAVFYTSSLTITGFLLILLSFGGYYVRVSQNDWAFLAYGALFATGLIGIALTFSSRKYRKIFNVFISKHLFNYKYDYREEWLKLISLLSQSSDNQEIPKRVIDAAADLFKCKGGALWIKKSKVFVPILQHEVTMDLSEAIEAEDSIFCKTLEKGTPFAPNSEDLDTQQFNVHLPNWAKSLERSWLIIPLLVEESLIGYLLLSDSKSGDQPNWEDLDLAKTVGRQLANFLARHEQSELLAQARQFEAFNKLSAFVMHDLKNLIAQQSLVVKNAEKHKDNPAFVDDTISTIKNSVDRMNNLLRKLQHSESSDLSSVSLKDVLIDAMKRCQKTPPSPTLSSLKGSINVKADFDSLVMSFTHVIHNAQEATPATGFVDIITEIEENNIVVIVEDNGEGMSDDFIKNRLFKPFESTKSGQGMGVGVYQVREYIESIGGDVRVESSPGQGTRFILSLPKAL